MAMDPTILSVLMGNCKIDEPLQMFDRVGISYNGFSTGCYICLGKHNIYFVSKEMRKEITEFENEDALKMSYLDITKVALDTVSNRKLLVQLSDGRNDDVWSEDQLIIRSDNRQQLVDRIAVCWQAEYMYQKYQVAKFPQGKLALEQSANEVLHNVDLLQVQPFNGYDSGFHYGGYSFWLREGFKDMVTGLKAGNYIHDDGWETEYGFKGNKVSVPPECTVSIHLTDPVSVMELEKDPDRNDLRTVATSYRQALSEGLGHTYVLVNSSYMKRMNRKSDVARWEGWELLIRSQKACIVCVILRRMFIPPLCDTVQDISVLMRCEANASMNFDTHEVLMDECRFIADSLAPNNDVEGIDQLYNVIIQARLDALQYNEETYAYLQGFCGMEPRHVEDGKKFLKACVKILDEEAQLVQDPDLLGCEALEDIQGPPDPKSVKDDMIAEASGLHYLSHPDMSDQEASRRRSAFDQRISRYMAYVVDGGVLGDRFTLSNIVGAVGKCGDESKDKILKGVVEYLLHIRQSTGNQLPLMQLLQDPDVFATCDFNERVMKVLLMDDYIRNEWRKRTAASAGTSVHYEKLLSALLRNGRIGLGLKTLICRQILEQINLSGDPKVVEQQIEVLVPALIFTLENKNVNLVSCATASLVNLSFNWMPTKTLLMQQGAMKLLVKQLKSRDDDLILYTLYLLVNMTKTPHHRSVVVREGGIPLLVDILSSSYQNVQRKRKILTELCSVFGQLCNDPETRGILSDDFPVTPCLLWIFDAAETNSKLRAKLLFTLRQLCGMGRNKMSIGQHIIFSVMEDVGFAKPEFQENAMNCILLLTELATIKKNALEIAETLKDRLIQCKIMSKDRGTELTNRAKFSPIIIEKIEVLNAKLKEMEYSGE